MSDHAICPWWMGYFLVNPARRLLQDPYAIVAPYVATGMTVLEPGPGMGFFTLPLAEAVGPTGRVVAVDVQPNMLAKLRQRAAKARVAPQVETRLVTGTALPVDDLSGKVDFALAFAMVHEVPCVDAFFRDVALAMKPGGKVLVAEPRGHVSSEAFASSMASAARYGLSVVERPTIRLSHAAVLSKCA